MEKRVEDLEVKVAFLEDQLLTLDGVVRALGAQLDGALRELKDLKDRPANSEEQRDLLHERPPHY